MSRWPCKKANGGCTPRLPGTIVRDASGRWLVIYCSVCGHAVRTKEVR